MQALASSLSLSLFTAGFFISRASMFYFSSATLIIGIIGAIYLFSEWLYHRRNHTFALLWAMGLFLLYWFQIPAILSLAGQRFTLTDFNTFFSFAFPMAFLGGLLIYAGILSVSRPPSPRRNTLLILWASIAAIIFFFYFANRNTITDYSSTFIFIFGFFLPLSILSLLELRQWRKKRQWSGAASLGIAILMFAFLVRIFQNIFALDRLLTLPPAFWFLAIADSSALFIMQTIGTLLLLVGFFLVHRSCREGENGGAL